MMVNFGGCDAGTSNGLTVFIIMMILIMMHGELYDLIMVNW